MVTELLAKIAETFSLVASLMNRIFALSQMDVTTRKFLYFSRQPSTGSNFIEFELPISAVVIDTHLICRGFTFAPRDIGILNISETDDIDTKFIRVHLSDSAMDKCYQARISYFLDQGEAVNLTSDGSINLVGIARGVASLRINGTATY